MIFTRESRQLTPMKRFFRNFRGAMRPQKLRKIFVFKKFAFISVIRGLIPHWFVKLPIDIPSAGIMK